VPTRSAASESDWDRALLRVGVGAFVVLAGMWALSVLYGHAGVPHLRAGALPVRGSLALHAATTAAIAAAAATLGGRSGGSSPARSRSTSCSACSPAWPAGASSRPGSCCGRSPASPLPLLLAGFGDDLSATVLVWAVAAVCLSHLGYEWKVRAPDQVPPPAQ